MSNHITITIEGRAHSGKTLITSIIEEVLKEKGVEVTVNDLDGPAYYKDFKSNLNAVTTSDKIHINEKLNQVGVTINQKHTPISAK